MHDIHRAYRRVYRYSLQHKEVDLLLELAEKFKDLALKFRKLDGSYHLYLFKHARQCYQNAMQFDREQFQPKYPQEYYGCRIAGTQVGLGQYKLAFDQLENNEVNRYSLTEKKVALIDDSAKFINSREGYYIVKDWLQIQTSHEAIEATNQPTSNTTSPILLLAKIKQLEITSGSDRQQVVPAPENIIDPIKIYIASDLVTLVLEEQPD